MKGILTTCQKSANTWPAKCRFQYCKTWVHHTEGMTVRLGLGSPNPTPPCHISQNWQLQIDQMSIGPTKPRPNNEKKWSQQDGFEDCTPRLQQRRSHLTVSMKAMEGPPFILRQHHREKWDNPWRECQGQTLYTCNLPQLKQYLNDKVIWHAIWRSRVALRHHWTRVHQLKFLSIHCNPNSACMYLKTVDAA